MKEYNFSELAIVKCKGNTILDESRDIRHFWEDPSYMLYEYRLNAFPNAPKTTKITHFGVSATSSGDFFEAYPNLINYHLDQIVKKQKKEISKYENILKQDNLSEFDRTHYELCLKNRLKFVDGELYIFALMAYQNVITAMAVALLSEPESSIFNETLDKYLADNPDFIPCTNLAQYNRTSGLYMMVLDKMNLVYIGQAKDIRIRIGRHWTNKSIPPGIDAYGPLDTTRIYVLPTGTNELNNKEINKILNFNPAYSLNKLIGGGLPIALDKSSLGAKKYACYNAMPRGKIRVIDLGYESFKENYLQLFLYPPELPKPKKPRKSKTQG